MVVAAAAAVVAMMMAVTLYGAGKDKKLNLRLRLLDERLLYFMHSQTWSTNFSTPPVHQHLCQVLNPLFPQVLDLTIGGHVKGNSHSYPGYQLRELLHNSIAREHVASYFSHHIILYHMSAYFVLKLLSLTFVTKILCNVCT